MSVADFYELLDPKTLRRLDLPKTAQSPQGLSNILLEKVLTPTYVTNDPNSIIHKTDIRAASIRTATGAGFVTPQDVRRIIFSIRFNYVCTATVGTRTYVIQRTDQTPTILNRWIQQTLTASQNNTVEISTASASGGTDFHRQIAFPFVLEANWQLVVNDVSNIDPNDTVAWQIEYLEIPYT